MTTTITAPARLCDRCQHDLTEHASPDQGFGYSRDPDTSTTPVPVPEGVELVFLTGRIRTEANR
ncbi:hypothetical protein EV385_1080 [Krasilnikovia cinnamomea]|uniref:Uncharacterized protein n=1 Tax=Krasilnikovia cinnamomea TaxID=349313 RepID=A0A4Q7ZGR1_9ACTN|nr:hypothetical protein [Krasilnikovia cinnamomea]RZU49335.1 hypothetical protein EV385_1080 [Krasilnikovia cinnamomea]